MKVECGECEGIIFWPSDEITAAFDRLDAAIGKLDELQGLQLFARTMKYFYDQAVYTTDHSDDIDMDELCRLAKKGLYLELGIPISEEEPAPEEKTA